ncbi:MAG: 30S ribosomal protein S20 [Puniceicoccales bacterium]|jgi:small subunit ribosomal protein S20|nr:30S ribosomal protein S20 [Puniceicoccales bacterium]
MANKKASLKSVKQITKRNIRNQMVLSRLHSGFKKVSALAKQNSEGIREAAIDYIAILDKAAKIGVIHHNKASRHKSMMTKYIF